MLDRSLIRENRVYWVIARKRDANTKPTLAQMTGELPSLSMRPLERANILYDSVSDFDFLGEADMDSLFEATFQGTAIGELLDTPIKARIAD